MAGSNAVTFRSRPVQIRKLMTSPGEPPTKHLRRVSAATTREAQAVARERVNSRSGAYLRGFSSTTKIGPNGPRTTIRNSAPHALILEKGSRAHEIVPRRPGGLLRFEIGGRTVYARRVQHPGTKPQRIMDTALRRTIRRFS